MKSLAILLLVALPASAHDYDRPPSDGMISACGLESSARGLMEDEWEAATVACAWRMSAAFAKTNLRDYLVCPEPEPAEPPEPAECPYSPPEDCRGDLDGDGMVGGPDSRIFRESFNSAAANGGRCP